MCTSIYGACDRLAVVSAFVRNQVGVENLRLCQHMLRAKEKGGGEKDRKDGDHAGFEEIKL